VTIDGHQFDRSIGASFWESAAVMRALGARDAVNLDGGGSTTMAIRGADVNRPSDATGERPIGDALLLASPR
jgi:exopolysaccharide biosynthesis protein